MDGWTILARRLRTPAGEADIVAQREGLLAVVEVKSRPTLAEAAASVTPQQIQRLIQTTNIILAEHPDWGPAGARLDLIAIDAKGRARRVADAFRDG